MDMDRNVAVCGLKCDECDIFKAKNNPQIAREVVNWFKNERDLDVEAEQIRCSGCRGDRSEHWSPDCEILTCCVDEKGLDFCHQCESFPCERLTERDKENKRYGEALDLLKEMKETRLKNSTNRKNAQ